MRRCYNEKEKLKWKSYLEAEVCEEWHDYRNFAKWYNDNYYQIDNMQMHIDKDILVKGNKIYSPETCVFVPYNINSLFTKGNTMRGDCPIGVNYHKRDKVFYARVRNNKGQRMELGGFSNPTDAFNAYKMAKEQIIKDVANEYKDKIPQRLYEAMIKYEVDITD